MIGVLFRLEARRLWRSRPLMAALLAWVVAAGGATMHGERAIARQRQALAASDALQAEQHAAVLSHQPPEANAGDQLYYLAFHTRHEPSAWAALSLGQRETRAFNLKVRILALHGQLYDGDLTSPVLDALGHVDFVFVLVVLAPLLVIAVAHDLVSGEHEAGTWPLLGAQPVSAAAVLSVKLAVRLGAVLAVAAGTTLVAPLAAGAPFDGRVVMAAVTVVAYVVLWGLAAFAVNTAGKGSDVNALALLGLWIAWVVVGPTLVATAASARFPAPEALELTVQQRQGYHGAWDRPVAETMAAFYQRYPEWASAPVPTDRYSNAWYYAMQQRGDDAAHDAAAGYFATLRARDAWVRGWWWLFPPAAMQAAFDRLARTDLPAHLAYLDSVATFHERLKRHFFPALFAEAPIKAVDWTVTPRHQHADDGVAGDLMPAVAGVGLWTAVAAVAVAMRRRRVQRSEP